MIIQKVEFSEAVRLNPKFWVRTGFLAKKLTEVGLNLYIPSSYNNRVCLSEHEFGNFDFADIKFIPPQVNRECKFKSDRQREIYTNTSRWGCDRQKLADVAKKIEEDVLVGRLYFTLQNYEGEVVRPAAMHLTNSDFHVAMLDWIKPIQFHSLTRLDEVNDIPDRIKTNPGDPEYCVVDYGNRCCILYPKDLRLKENKQLSPAW